MSHRASAPSSSSPNSASSARAPLAWACTLSAMAPSTSLSTKTRWVGSKTASTLGRLRSRWTRSAPPTSSRPACARSSSSPARTSSKFAESTPSFSSASRRRRGSESPRGGRAAWLASRSRRRRPSPRRRSWGVRGGRRRPSRDPRRRRTASRPATRAPRPGRFAAADRGRPRPIPLTLTATRSACGACKRCLRALRRTAPCQPRRRACGGGCSGGSNGLVLSPGTGLSRRASSPQASTLSRRGRRSARSRGSLCSAWAWVP
mmetsp:Transcript_16335/g.41355  ORF Transcript_16335/g.41355 Transcript_16335/m.41355 type:complete len:262 (+) Transcript_16335:1241-2026(+)